MAIPLMPETEHRAAARVPGFPEDKVLRPHIVLDSELPTVHPSAERSSHAVSALIFLSFEWIN